MSSSLGPPYQNPPIEEAIVEFRFVPTGWNPELVERFCQHENIRSFYDGLRKVMQVQHIRFEPEKQPEVSRQKELPRQMLLDLGGTRLLTIGHDVLSVNSQRPYEGFDEVFKGRIETALRVYDEVVANCQVIRIGVRYINKIALTGENKNRADHFKFRPFEPSIPGFALQSFLERGHLTSEDQTQVLVTHVPVAGESTPTFLLDIDVFKSFQDTPLSLAAAIAETVTLHNQEKQVFEAMIKDEARRLFHGA
jgi:uncharacterized protein (TIGR04255 family)